MVSVSGSNVLIDSFEIFTTERLTSASCAWSVASDILDLDWQRRSSCKGDGVPHELTAAFACAAVNFDCYHFDRPETVQMTRA